MYIEAGLSIRINLKYLLAAAFYIIKYMRPESTLILSMYHSRAFHEYLLLSELVLLMSMLSQWILCLGIEYAVLGLRKDPVPKVCCSLWGEQVSIFHLNVSEISPALFMKSFAGTPHQTLEVGAPLFARYFLYFKP
jgi:hypothetical protein